MIVNLPKIQSLAAPLTAPVPSALGVGLEAFKYFSHDGVWLGWIAAVGAFIGIETLGGASCYAVIKLHRQRNYGIEIIVAILGIAVYVGSGWYTLAHTPLIIFFFMAPFSYFAYSIIQSMEAEIKDKEAETEAQIKLIEAQKRLTNAETRKAKVGYVDLTNATTYPTNATENKSYICPYCLEDQRTPQRYSVHIGRYCKKKDV